MEKKLYEAPEVKKVSLDITNAILTVCFTSTLSDPVDTCKVDQCFVS
ncbi:MAG: hypothetical protein ABFC97_01050 [Anaerolineaceae bacterium]